MTAVPEHVIWHDVECGRYQVDIALWHELATAADGPILDVGAGTGRVALELARHGHEVVALDLDRDLLATLSLRAAAAGVAVETVVADASSFELDRRGFAIVMAPMQTVQLLRPEGRLGFLRSARAHVAPGGLVAIALVDAMETFDEDHVLLPLPDELVDRRHPVLQSAGRAARQGRHRRDRAHPPDRHGRRPAQRERGRPAARPRRRRSHRGRGRGGGLRVLPSRVIAETDEHVGTTVVLLRG